MSYFLALEPQTMSDRKSTISWVKLSRHLAVATQSLYVGYFIDTYLTCLVTKMNNMTHLPAPTVTLFVSYSHDEAGSFATHLHSIRNWNHKKSWPASTSLSKLHARHHSLWLTSVYINMRTYKFVNFRKTKLSYFPCSQMVTRPRGTNPSLFQHSGFIVVTRIDRKG